MWGATRTLPPLCFVLEVLDPGVLVVKRRKFKFKDPASLLTLRCWKVTRLKCWTIPL